MEELAEMNRMANYLMMAAWNDWSADMKFDLCSHPQAEESLVRASIQLWGVTDPLRISTQHPTMEARNSNALLDTRPWR